MSDNNVNNLSEQELAELIDSGVGSNSEKNDYIQAWVDKHYGANFNRLSGNRNAITSSISLHGIRNNQIIRYVDGFLNSTQGDLEPEYLQLVGNLISTKTVDANTEWLYEPWLYNETTKNNIYKLKALAFVGNKRNVRSYGLQDEDGNPLTVRSLTGKTAEQMLDIIEKSQTKNFDDDGDYTFLDIARDNKNAAEDEIAYYQGLIKKLNLKDGDTLIKALDAISNDNFQKKDFLYSETSSATVQNDLVKYLQQFVKNKGRTLTKTSANSTRGNKSGRYTVSDWLSDHNLSPIDLYSNFSRDLSTKVSRGLLSKYREYLSTVLNNKKQLDQLLKYQVSDDTTDAMLNSLVSYLNSFHELVKKQNRMKKAEADMESKPEVKQLMNDVIDALVTNLQLSRDEAKTKFKQYYQPGKTEEDILGDIIRSI